MLKSKKSPPLSASSSTTSFHTAPQNPPENAVAIGLASAAHVSRTFALAASSTPLCPSSSTSLPPFLGNGSPSRSREPVASTSTSPPNASPETVYATTNTAVSLFSRKPLIKATHTAPPNFSLSSPPSSPSKSSSSPSSRPSPLSQSHSPSRDVHHVKYAHGAVTTREEWTIHGRGGMTSSAILNKPSTAAEHYWAARALTAEAILEARMDHQQELKSLKVYEDEKRTVSSIPPLPYTDLSVVLSFHPNKSVC